MHVFFIYIKINGYISKNIVVKDKSIYVRTYNFSLQQITLIILLHLNDTFLYQNSYLRN